MQVILGKVPFPADFIIYLKSNIISPLIIFHNYKQPDSSEWYPENKSLFIYAFGCIKSSKVDSFLLNLTFLGV